MIENIDDNKHYITIPYIIKILEKFSKIKAMLKDMFKDNKVKIHITYDTQKVGKKFLSKGLNCMCINQLIIQVIIEKVLCLAIKWYLKSFK